MTQDNNFRHRPGNFIPHTLGEVPALETAEFPRELVISVSFLTDFEALSALLPNGIVIADEPILNFRFRYSDGITWGLGGDHNAIGVSVPVKYEASDGVYLGIHWLALWEDDPMAVILGREQFGVAKLCADIHTQLDVAGKWRAVLSEEARPMIEITFSDRRPIEGESLISIQERARKGAVIGWKQIPNVHNTEPVVSHPTYFPHVVKVDQAWSGVGQVHIFETDPEIHIWPHHIVEAIRSLPLHKCVGSFMTKGSAKLLISEGRILSGKTCP